MAFALKSALSSGIYILLILIGGAVLFAMEAFDILLIGGAVLFAMEAFKR